MPSSLCPSLYKLNKEEAFTLDFIDLIQENRMVWKFFPIARKNLPSSGYKGQDSHEKFRKLQNIVAFLYLQNIHRSEKKKIVAKINFVSDILRSGNNAVFRPPPLSTHLLILFIAIWLFFFFFTRASE